MAGDYWENKKATADRQDREKEEKFEATKKALHPRHDIVLCEMVTVEKTESGIAVPQISQEGKKYVVVKTGPDVKHDLKPGMAVLIKGQEHVDWAFLPNSSRLFICRDKDVTIWQEESVPGPRVDVE